MIYLDTCIAIYAVENERDIGRRVRERIRAEIEPIVVSPLVVHECLVKPLRDRDTELHARYLDYFKDLTILDLDLPAFIRAAELRAAAPSLRVPDALHLAAAQLAGCRELWTNDRRLTSISRGLAVDVIG